ncbi:D-TA family PLP-dependent enzyme [Paludisphaera borealis]|uniref:D-threonine aldolase n=1 Tax=Paludisphaera borealis TaxID=1387353 RepID=A0A1U7CY85_9BACT|nr:D-TA family PLP-dependent enzyme [Paludisphaera borealis]APW63839.1 D-threonine aldolase [Paludisphaera borealis]
MSSLYELFDPETLPSPSLLVFRDLVERNLTEMIRMARGVERLRPHAKTHKTSKLIRMAREMGVVKQKCATIAEAEMIAGSGVTDVLLAYPLVGPNVARFIRLIRAYPKTTFRAIVDAPESASALSQAAQRLDHPIPVLVDLEVGMMRTGIDPGDPAVALYERIDKLPNLAPDGLHAYDGHIHDSDLELRAQAARRVEETTLSLRDRLIAKGIPVPRVVMGGTPTFPIHAALDAPGLECSPGTILLHDYNYQTNYPDLPFIPAALLLTRVVSRPRPGRLCLDLGHKAVAADPVGPRVFLPDIPDARIVGHSEEHLVIETADADRFPLGTPLLAIPAHICPTSALHRRMLVITDGKLVDEWEVTARDRMIGV